MAMVFVMIMIDISKYDKLLEDLKAMLFSERKSRKLNRIEPNFYKNIHSLFVELTEEKDRVLSVLMESTTITSNGCSCEIRETIRSLIFFSSLRTVIIAEMPSI